ncbi:Transcriptional regulator (plasmid) [Tistrella mobilis KA081020-065]|uniref:Transcriptional regulator n=2 Tax=Tistrella mobilis TaxID=171437 RepID=I3TVI8_TISMK|nr:Transcriptional regulator [Tistrella mobilis KA081020-065]
MPLASSGGLWLDVNPDSHRERPHQGGPQEAGMARSTAAAGVVPITGTREKLCSAGFAILRRAGFSGLSVSAVAEDAEVAVGTVYRHFTSKAELCAELFRRASTHELKAVADAIRGQGPADRRIANAVATFAARALAGRALAYALLAEPVDPLVDTERLAARRRYTALYAEAVATGLAEGDLAPQPPELAAAAMVGVVSEALVGPLARARIVDPGHGVLTEADVMIIAEIVGFCRRGLTGRPDVTIDTLRIARRAAEAVGRG